MNTIQHFDEGSVNVNYNNKLILTILNELGVIETIHNEVKFTAEDIEEGRRALISYAKRENGPVEFTDEEVIQYIDVLNSDTPKRNNALLPNERNKLEAADK